MGANVSATYDKALSVIKNTASTSCTNFMATDQEISGIQLNFRGSRCGDIDFTNRATLVSNCNMSAIAQALAESSMQLTKTQAAGLTLPLTFNVSLDVADRTKIIEQELVQQCGSEALAKQRIRNVSLSFDENSSCDNIRFLNDASITTQCVAAVVADAVSSQKDTTNIAQTNAISPWALLAIFVPILIFIGVLYFLFRSKPAGPPGKKVPPSKKGVPGSKSFMGKTLPTLSPGVTSAIRKRASRLPVGAALPNL